MATFTQNYESWHQSKETADIIRQFAERFARQPDCGHLREIQHDIITRIEKILKQDKKCVNMEFTGSAYEGVQIGPGIEFDVMVVIDGSGISVKESQHPGYYELSAKEGFFWGIDEKYKQFLSGMDNILRPTRVGSTFFGSLQKAVSYLTNQGLSQRIKLRSHGPAVQMDVFSYNDYFLFSVDVVPSFKSGGQMFVAKPFKQEELNSDMSCSNLWRISTSLDEKKVLDRIDSGNHCRKKVLRITKAMHDQDQLQGFNSYHFKTALMHLCQQLTCNSSWKESQLPVRFMDMLSVLEHTLKEKYMPHRFISNMNLYANISDYTMENMYHRIRRIRKCEHIFRSIFTVDYFEAQSYRSESSYHSESTCPKCAEAVNGDPSLCSVM